MFCILKIAKEYVPVLGQPDVDLEIGVCLLFISKIETGTSVRIKQIGAFIRTG